MKKSTLSLIASFLFCVTAYAQTPAGFNWQGTIRDASSNIMASQAVNMQFTIRSSSSNGTIEYRETHNITTSPFGVAETRIGEGNVVSGNFDDIEWGSDDHFLQVEIDDAGTMADLGTTQLMSVPYAMYAENGASHEQKATAWVHVPVTGNPNLLFDGFNVSNVSKTTTGVYQISLTPGSFSPATNPAVNCNVVNDLSPGVAIATYGSSPSQITVRTYNMSGTPTDKEFNLTIFGK